MSQSLVIIKIWLTIKLVFKCIIVLLILCQIIDNVLMHTFSKRWVEKQKTTAQAGKTTAVAWYRYPRTRTSKRNIAQHSELKNVSRRSLNQGKNTKQSRKFDSTVRDAVQCCALTFGCAGTANHATAVVLPAWTVVFYFSTHRFAKVYIKNCQLLAKNIWNNNAVEYEFYRQSNLYYYQALTH